MAFDAFVLSLVVTKRCNGCLPSARPLAADTGHVRAGHVHCSERAAPTADVSVLLSRICTVAVPQPTLDDTSTSFPVSAAGSISLNNQAHLPILRPYHLSQLHA